MSTATETSLIRVGTCEEVVTKGCVVVRGADRQIAVFHDGGQFYAVDNRCPHMGFPLHRGSIQDGMITCHWHHARFDAASGCTFDLFADDVPGYDVEVRDGEVWVAPKPRPTDAVSHGLRRLNDGLAQNVSLIVAKSILGLEAAGVKPERIARELALFAAHNQDGWPVGLYVLGMVCDLLPDLSERTAYQGLFQAARRIAGDTAGQPPHRERPPLETDVHDFETLERWLRYWTMVRHRDGAERTLRTAIDSARIDAAQVTELLGVAGTERPYANGGHLIDAVNKAMELLDYIGADCADELLPCLVPTLVSSRGGEEANSWRHPIDLLHPTEELCERLPALFIEGDGRVWNDTAKLAHTVLGEDPLAILAAIEQAVRAGARPRQISQAVAYAAALRVARFGTANEQPDWITALHVFTYCNAVDQLLHRSDTPLLARGAVHGAVEVYLNRFLNVPPAHLPGERGVHLDDLPREPQELLDGYLDALDSQHEVDRAARMVARYLSLGLDPLPLVDTLAWSVLREDFDFHSLQMVEAGVRQYRSWGDGPEGHTILVAIARYVAAHSPTQRGQLQTANIALRLHRGEAVFEEE